MWQLFFVLCPPNPCSLLSHKLPPPPLPTSLIHFVILQRLSLTLLWHITLYILLFFHSLVSIFWLLLVLSGGAWYFTWQRWWNGDRNQLPPKKSLGLQTKLPKSLFLISLQKNPGIHWKFPMPKIPNVTWNLKYHLHPPYPGLSIRLNILWLNVSFIVCYGIAVLTRLV